MRWAVCLACAIALASGSAAARPVRRLFEPTDLQLENAGVAEFDFQTGLIRGDAHYRLVVPDFEIDLGITRRLELDVDGTVNLEDQSGTRTFDHVSPDNLWVSAKVGLAALTIDLGHSDRDPALGFGLQIGPKLPTARQAEGIGVEGVALVGLNWRRTQAVLNLGGLVDPGNGNAGRPKAIEGGIDFTQGLDARGLWSFVAGLGGVAYTTADNDQLTLTAGLELDPTEMLTLSLQALVGLIQGSDRYGVLLEVSPKVRLWH